MAGSPSLSFLNMLTVLVICALSITSNNAPVGVAKGFHRLPGLGTESSSSKFAQMVGNSHGMQCCYNGHPVGTVGRVLHNYGYYGAVPTTSSLNTFSATDFLFLNPNCLLNNPRSLSVHFASLFRVIFSSSLPRVSSKYVYRSKRYCSIGLLAAYRNLGSNTSF